MSNSKKAKATRKEVRKEVKEEAKREAKKVTKSARRRARREASASAGDLAGFGAGAASDLFKQAGSATEKMRRVIADANLRELEYVRCLMNPTRENAVGRPGVNNLVPTSVVTMSETGSLSTAADGTFLGKVWPRLNDFAEDMPNWGIASSTGSYTEFNAAYGLFNLCEMVRMVACKVTVRPTGALLNQAGTVTMTYMPSDRVGDDPGTQSALSEVPGAKTFSLTELNDRKDGFSTIWLPNEGYSQSSTTPFVVNFYSPDMFFPPDSSTTIGHLLSNEALPHIEIAVAGAPASTAFANIQIDAVWEFTQVAGMQFGCRAERPMGGSKALEASQLASHPNFVQAVEQDSTILDTTKSMASWLWNNWGEVEDAGSAVLDILGYAAPLLAIAM